MSKPGDNIQSKRIRARLSFSGWVYVALCLVIGLAAVNSNNNVLFLLTSLLLSLLFLSGLTALYNVSGLKILADNSSLLTAGEPGMVMVSVLNKKRLSSLVLDVSLGPDSALIPSIPAGKQKDVFLTWTPPHRGMPDLPRVRAASSFPFGFVVRGGFFDTKARLLTAPRTAGNVPDILSANILEQLSSGSTGQGRGDWKGIRQHLPGEGKASIVWRRVDWQKPEIGLDSSLWPAHSFAQESSRFLVLDWDDPVFAHLDTEKRLSIFRSVLDMAAAKNRSWELRLTHTTVSGAGRINHEHALRALALVEPLPGPDSHRADE